MFYKVDQRGGTYITATFYDPDTQETTNECVRDYDYSDGSRDNDALYFMPINQEVRVLWLHHNGVILVGDTVEVTKGRKVPIGTVGKVIGERTVHDRYNRAVARYVVLDNGFSTNADNCKLVG